MITDYNMNICTQYDTCETVWYQSHKLFNTNSIIYPTTTR